MFKTSESIFLDLSTGLTIAMLITVGKNLLLKNHLKWYLNLVVAQGGAVLKVNMVLHLVQIFYLLGTSNYRNYVVICYFSKMF